VKINSLRKDAHVSRVAGLHILWEQKSPDSYGHTLIDNIYPMFVVLKNLGLDDPSAQMVFMKNCTQYSFARRRGPTLVAACERLQKLYTPGMSTKSVKYFADVVGEVGVSRGYVRFERVVLGGGGHRGSWATQKCGPNRPWPGINMGSEVGIRGARGSGHYWLLIRDQFLRNHALDYAAVPKKHRVVFMDKHGGRGGRTSGERRINNIDQMVAIVQKRWPNYQVDKVNFQPLTHKEQLELLSRTTLLISPPGSASFRMVFLPPGGSVNIIGLPKGGYHGLQSAHWESDVWWKFLSHVNVLNHPVADEEVVSLKQARGQRSKLIIGDFKDSNIMLNEHKLLSLVNQSFYNMRACHGGTSF